ncbi:MAG: AAA family ATPase, partial [Luteolibacter sp.]
PLAVFLFLGSTGVGKTETVRVLSEAILGSVDELCRIDMNTLAQEHYAAAITGAPPGYVGSKENHSLFDFEKVEGSYGKPGIVLFDEIEKADKQVARTLLNVLDSGVLELSSGNRRLSFANAMIFMTSNEGAGELQRYREKFDTGWRKWVGKKLSKVKEREILNRALRAKFDPEFLNRIDRVVHFEPLGESFLDQILEVELEMLEKRLSKFQVGLEVDEAAREFLTQGHDTRYGARHLRRRIRQHLEPKLARVLNGDGGVKVLRVGCEGECLVVSYG